MHDYLKLKSFNHDAEEREVSYFIDDLQQIGKSDSRNEEQEDKLGKMKITVCISAAIKTYTFRHTIPDL